MAYGNDGAIEVVLLTIIKIVTLSPSQTVEASSFLEDPISVFSDCMTRSFADGFGVE